MHVQKNQQQQLEQQHAGKIYVYIVHFAVRLRNEDYFSDASFT